MVGVDMEPILLHDPKTGEEGYFDINESDSHEAKGDGWPDETTYRVSSYLKLISCWAVLNSYQCVQMLRFR